MKAISLTEPWATLVCLGKKRFETRSWYDSYRGLMAVHAAKNMPREAVALCLDEPFRSALGDWGVIKPFHKGCIIGVVELTQVVRTSSILADSLGEPELSFGDYTDGRYAWQLERPVMLPEPIPCRGALGLWTVPDDIAAAVKAGL